jgi:hypothetical protein
MRAHCQRDDDFKAIAVIQIGALDLDAVIWRYPIHRRV